VFLKSPKQPYLCHKKNMVTLTNSELRALGNIQKYCKDTYLVKKAGVLLGVYAQVSLNSLSLMFNLHERTISNYIDSYLDNGLETYLTPSQQGGARSRLSVEQAETVKTAIEEEPPIAAKAVVEVIKKK
jgi:transposase